MVIMQKLMCFKCAHGAVSAQIELHPERVVYRIVTIDVNNHVVELAEFPVQWGLWACREFLMSSDLKAKGRTTNSYDSTPW